MANSHSFLFVKGVIIIAVVKNLMVRAGADFSGMKREMDKANKNMQDFSKGMKGALKGLVVTLATLGIGTIIKDATKSAMDVEASMQQINRTMGSSAQAFTDWANKGAIAFNMGKSDAIKYGAIYSNLISTFSKDTGTTMNYTEDLLKSSAVVASSTGRTMSDVMERIRSGMLGNTEAIEDLGINVGINMISSTNAFKKFANGKSWDQIDFQTQQQIRLFAILEQSTQKYGDSVANNTNSNMQQFVAQLKNIQLSLGQAFLPILNVVLPMLTSLAAGLAQVMSIFAQFTQALFGKSQDQTKATGQQANAVSGLGDAYTEAGKAARGATAGFDEVNTLSDSSGGGAGNSSPASLATATGGQSGTSEATDPISKNVQEMANKVKVAFKAMSDFIKEHKDLILASLAGLGAGFTTFLIATNWAKIIGGIRTAFLLLGESIEAVWLALTGPIGLIAIAIGLLIGAFIYFYKTNETFRGIVDGILKAIGDAAVWLLKEVLVPLGVFLKDVFIAAWEGITKVATWLWKEVLVPMGDFLIWFWHNVIEPLGAVLTDVLGVAFDAVAKVARSFWEDVMIPLGNFFTEIFGPAVEALSAVFNFLWNDVLKPLSSWLVSILKPSWQVVVDVIEYLWYEVLKPLVTWIADKFVTIFTNSFKAIGEIIGDLSLVLTKMLNFITDVFKGDWEQAWQDVKEVFKGVWETLYDVAKAPLNAIIDMVNILIDGLNKIHISLPDVPGFPGTGMSFGISIPKIPKLARGGFVDGATNMGNYIAGEAGAEMVVPLENTSFVDKLASALGTAVMSAMQFSGGNNKQQGDIALQVDGITFARLMNPYSAKESNRIGGAMITTL